MKTRGASSNPVNRYHRVHSEYFEAIAQDVQTRCYIDRAKTIISHNRSPDIPFSRSINPYRGCEHGCIYCFARPSHAYLDLSPGLDFETKIFARTNAAELLEQALGHKNYRCQPIALGTNTDPYQPLEKKMMITRSILETALKFSHPVTIVTKSALIRRDLDLLKQLAHQNLVHVMISVTTLDREIKRTMEPRAPSASARLNTIRELADADVPVGSLIAPVIPRINDHELEDMVSAVARVGAWSAGYVLLRLPLELTELFQEWLDLHYPDRAEHVMSLMRQSHAGREYNPKFGTRMRGTGRFAELIARRFSIARKKNGLNRRMPQLDRTSFRVPMRQGQQYELF